MKKTVLFILTMSIFSFSQAEYVMTTPLSGNNGVLPQGAITIEAKSTPSVPDAAPLADTCDYNRLNGLYWMVVTNEGPRQVAHVSWNNTTLYDYNEQGHIGDATEVVFNGVTYKRGTQQMTDYYSVTYGVCRVNN